jgi:hypothetical protein
VWIFWRRVKLLTPHWNQTQNCPAYSLANIPNTGWSNVCVCVCVSCIYQATDTAQCNIRKIIANHWTNLLSLVPVPHNTKIMQAVHSVAWCTLNLKSMHYISINAGQGFSSTFRVKIREVLFNLSAKYSVQSAP